MSRNKEAIKLLNVYDSILLLLRLKKVIDEIENITIQPAFN